MTKGVFKYSPLDFLLTVVGLVFLLLDIALDVLAVVEFYREKSYACLGVLVLLLVGSSVLVQAFSWLWYSYDDFERHTRAEAQPSVCQLKLLHVFQLGIYFRHAGVVELSIPWLRSNVPDAEGRAANLSHDLSFLRLIETFSESAPQLVLMLTIFLQQKHFSYVTVLKAMGSASAIAFSVTMYHRSMRSFLPDKEKQRATSSAVYFLWNLLLISPRIAALALFASHLPCYIFAHFLCSWTLLLLAVWRSRTDFMDSPGGEWLYRATAGLIWYFDWLNVAEGKTRNMTLLYHGYMLADISVLCGVWCFKLSAEPPYFEIPGWIPATTAAGVIAVYILGLVFKIVYYKFCHPNVAKDELKGDVLEKSAAGMGPPTTKLSEDVVDFPMSTLLRYAHPMTLITEEETAGTDVMDRSWPGPPPDTKRCNKRMRNLAANFYS